LLGDGVCPGDSPYPLKVVDLLNVVKIKAWDDYALALRNDGTVWAWGVPNIKTPTKVQTPTGSVAVDIAAGAPPLALMSDGTVQALALAGYPSQVAGLNGVTAIASGGGHQLALKADGTVVAWGRNNDGQLGNGTTLDSSTPVQVSNLEGVKAIAAGSTHSLALKTDGTVWGWGWNFSGELGSQTNCASEAPTPNPVQAEGLSEVVAIDTGFATSFAIKSDGTAWAFGWNDFWQYGNGTTRGSDMGSCFPLKVLDGVKSVATGYGHTLFLMKGPTRAFREGTILATGLNDNGQLGDGTHISRTVPFPVRFLG
jgi:alpha-tubulin suppressor-like RCC1 family protein